MVHQKTDLCSDDGGEAFVHEPCLPLHETRICGWTLFLAN